MTEDAANRIISGLAKRPGAKADPSPAGPVGPENPIKQSIGGAVADLDR